MHQPRPSHWILLATIPLAALLIGLLAAEGLCRLGLVKSMFYYRHTLAHELKDKEKRVLLLGDSFTYPESESSFGKLMAEKLGDSQLAIFNLGWPGTGVLTYLRQLRRHGPTFRPQWVFLNYYVGNDLSDTATETRYGISPEEEPGWKTLLLSQALSERWSRLKPLLKGSKAPTKVSSDSKKPIPVNPHLTTVAESYPDYVWDNLAMESPKAQNLWRVNRDLILRIRDATQEMGAKLAIFIFPHTLQVSNHHADFLKAMGFNHIDEIIGTHIPQDKFKEFCEAEALKCVDILPALTKASASSLYIENDDHWNEEGNRIAFNEVKQFMVEEKIASISESISKNEDTHP